MLQLCFYRPSLAVMLTKQNEAVRKSLEELLFAPILFVRRFVCFVFMGVVIGDSFFLSQKKKKKTLKVSIFVEDNARVSSN